MNVMRIKKLTIPLAKASSFIRAKVYKCRRFSVILFIGTGNLLDHPYQVFYVIMGVSGSFFNCGFTN